MSANLSMHFLKKKKWTLCEIPTLPSSCWKTNWKTTVHTSIRQRRWVPIKWVHGILWRKRNTKALLCPTYTTTKWCGRKEKIRLHCKQQEQCSQQHVFQPSSGLKLCPPQAMCRILHWAQGIQATHYMSCGQEEDQRFTICGSLDAQHSPKYQV